MIVDCHTHIWQSPDQLGLLDLGEMASASGSPTTAVTAGGGGRRLFPPGDLSTHWKSAERVDCSIVLGFRSRYLDAHIPSRYVADYVSRHPGKLIGFAGIDPTERTALDDVYEARQLQLRGLVVSPPNQDFHPTDTRAMKVYALAQKLDMPVLFHPVTPRSPKARLEFASPVYLDEVARSFPDLRIVVAQMAQPFVHETVALLMKHEHVYADVAGVLSRRWVAYQALSLAHQYDVLDKLLFGSDFPYRPVERCIEDLYSINQVAQGTQLPTIPREQLRALLERDTLSLLGLKQ